MSEDGVTLPWVVGKRMAQRDKDIADKYRAGVIFQSGVGNLYIADPPRQSWPFICMICNEKHKTYENYMKHTCGVVKV